MHLGCCPVRSWRQNVHTCISTYVTAATAARCGKCWHGASRDAMLFSRVRLLTASLCLLPLARHVARSAGSGQLDRWSWGYAMPARSAGTSLIHAGLGVSWAQQSCEQSWSSQGSMMYSCPVTCLGKASQRPPSLKLRPPAWPIQVLLEGRCPASGKCPAAAVAMAPTPCTAAHWRQRKRPPPPELDGSAANRRTHSGPVSGLAAGLGARLGSAHPDINHIYIYMYYVCMYVCVYVCILLESLSSLQQALSQ